MFYLVPVPKQFVDFSGVPYSGGSVTVYVHGTTDKAEIYAEADSNVLLNNPCQLDSNGAWKCFVPADTPLDYIVQDRDGNVVAPFLNIVMPMIDTAVTKGYVDSQNQLRDRNFALNYDPTQAYQIVGTYVMNGGSLYKSAVVIDEPEEWNAEHWTECNVTDELNAKIAAETSRAQDAEAAAKTEVVQGENCTIEKTTAADGHDVYTVNADGKPQVQSDWNQSDSTKVDYIKNKPNLGLKADKVQGATAGNLAALDASGNLTDSGKKVADFKTKQTAVTDPTADGNGLSFIDSVTQNANGEITPHKKTVQDGTTTQKGVVQLNNAIDSTSTTEAATPKAVKDAYDELNNKIVARAVFLSQAEWAVQSQIPGDPAKVYYVEDGTGEDAYTVYVWKDSTSEYVEVDESSIDLDGYWHDGPNTTGTGNVVTNITLGNDGVPQVEKGLTALTQHQSVTDNNPTLAWGAKSKVGTIGSTDLHVTMPTDAGGWSLASGNGRYMKFASTENPSSGEMRTIDLAVANNVLGIIGLVRISVSQNQSSVTPTIIGANDDFVTMFGTTKPKVLTFKDSSGKFTYVLDSGSHYNTSANYVFYVIGGNAGKWTFFGNTNAVGDSDDLDAGTHQSDLDVTFGFDVTAKKSLTADTATSADYATNAGDADYASTAGSANSVAWSSVTDKPSIPTKDSNLTNDRYVRFDANNQGLTDTQKSNARTNIGAGTSSLTLGTTSITAARGNHAHGLLDIEGYLSDQNWAVSNLDRLVIAKNNYNGKVGYLVPSALIFDSDEKNKALTQSAEWKTFLPPNGDGSSVSVTPDGTSTGTDIGNSTTLKVWAQKFKNLVNALKALAFKDKVSDSDISGTISDSHISSASTWNGKQNALSAQTAYSAKGSATKVPQITTNSLGQVTGISEVTISGVTPSSHASTGTTYGAGTTANYGHVILLDGDLNGKTYADGVAAASAHTHSQYLTSHQSITTGSRNGSIAVSGRDVNVKGLGSLAYKSTIGTGDVSSGTYSISISGTAAKATNDSTGDNIADQFTSVRQGLSGLQGTVDGILTDSYFFRGVRYYYPSIVEQSLTPTSSGKILASWTGYNTSNLRIYGQLNLIVCNKSSTGYWYDLQIRYYPLSGGTTKTITWTKYAPPNNDGSNIIYMPLFNYTVEVYIYKNSNKNTGAFNIYRECILYTGVKEHVDG